METPARPVLTIRRGNGRIVKTDLTTLGPMLAYYRLRAGLSTTALAMQTLSCSSSTISSIESGMRSIGSRGLALRMAESMKLSPRETDHFLHVAGYATVLDWQQFCQDILTDLGLGSVYEHDSDTLYATLTTPTRRRQ